MAHHPLLFILLRLFGILFCVQYTRAAIPTSLSQILCEKPQNNVTCKNFTNFETGSALLSLIGHPSRLIYNRVPKTGSEMLRMLFREQADLRHFSIDNVEIFVPFLLPAIVQQEVVQHVSYAKTPFLYERHMYFLDFQMFKQPRPIYINIIRDPISRVTSEYYWSRKICLEENRCYFDKAFLSDTLDECVQKRSAHECISVSQGVNSMTSFFCGHDPQCETRSNFTLKRAKKNVIENYVVIGFVEELYNFFFVLEHILPRYFKNICLTYMSSGHTREEKKTWTRGLRPEPLEKTKQLLREALADEYELYDFVKQRFHMQMRQILKSTYATSF